MVDRNTKENCDIFDVIIPSVINFVIFYFIISLYNIFVNNEPIVSVPRALVSVYAVVCIYFESNGYHSVLNKIRNYRDENTDKSQINTESGAGGDIGRKLRRDSGLVQVRMSAAHLVAIAGGIAAGQVYDCAATQTPDPALSPSGLGERSVRNLRICRPKLGTQLQDETAYGVQITSTMYVTEPPLVSV